MHAHCARVLAQLCTKIGWDWMKTIIKNRKHKRWVTIALFASLALYILFCVLVNQERNKLYNSRITLRLMSFCNNILMETYGQNLGPSRDSTAESVEGSYRQIAEVYFPGIAPQTVSCFIQQDKTWVGYNAKTKVHVNLSGVTYAPTWFDKNKELKFSGLNTTLEALDKKYIAPLHIEPTNKPTFRFLTPKEVIVGVSYLDV
jgi:hypothetical protein